MIELRPLELELSHAKRQRNRAEKIPHLKVMGAFTCIFVWTFR